MFYLIQLVQYLFTIRYANVLKYVALEQVYTECLAQNYLDDTYAFIEDVGASYNYCVNIITSSDGNPELIKNWHVLSSRTK